MLAVIDIKYKTSKNSKFSSVSYHVLNHSIDPHLFILLTFPFSTNNILSNMSNVCLSYTPPLLVFPPMLLCCHFTNYKWINIFLTIVGEISERNPYVSCYINGNLIEVPEAKWSKYRNCFDVCHRPKSARIRLLW